MSKGMKIFIGVMMVLLKLNIIYILYLMVSMKIISLMGALIMVIAAYTFTYALLKVSDFIREKWPN